MRSVHRCLILTAAWGACATAAGQSLEGTFTIEFRYRAEGTEQLEDFDGIWLRKTTYDHAATMRCPVVSSGEEPISPLSFMSPETADQPPREGRFEMWYSEDCEGEMTINDQVVLTKGSATNVRERITGTRPLGNVDANITVETNLETMQTRYAIIPPEAEGFAREADDGRTDSGPMAAIPEGTVIAGPYPGPVKDGSYTRKVPGGEYSIDWTFARKP